MFFGKKFHNPPTPSALNFSYLLIYLFSLIWLSLLAVDRDCKKLVHVNKYEKD